MNTSLTAIGAPYEDGFTEEGLDEWTNNLTDAWVAAKDNVGDYWEGWEAGITHLVEGDAILLVGWNDIFALAAAELEEELELDDGREVLGYIAPEEPKSITAWAQSLAIRAGLEEDDPFLWEAAHAYINANLGKWASAFGIEYYGFIYPHKEAQLVVDPWPWWIIEEFHLDDPETAFARANLQPIAPPRYMTHGRHSRRS